MASTSLHRLLRALLLLCVLFFSSSAWAVDDDVQQFCRSEATPCQRECQADYNDGASRQDFQVCISNCVIIYEDCVDTYGDRNRDALSDTLCRIIELIYGPIGRSIATIAIFFAAVLTFLGRMTWGMALVILAGITGMFGAIDLVEWFTSYTACEGIVASPVDREELTEPLRDTGGMTDDSSSFTIYSD